MTGIESLASSEFNKGCLLGRISEPQWVEDMKRKSMRRN
jgi:hypothetical protein